MRGYCALGLFSPKNSLNYGGLLRAAHCYGAGLIVLEAPRFQNFASDTTKASKHIPTIMGPVCEHRPHDCPMVVIEIIEGAQPLPEFQHPQRAFYVFGPEDGSVPKRIVERAQHVVSIPTAWCMNLAATVNVVLYDRLAKSWAKQVRRAA